MAELSLMCFHSITCPERKPIPVTISFPYLLCHWFTSNIPSYGRQGISLSFGSILFLPCSKQLRDPSTDNHVILVWWDLLFSLACLKISLSSFLPHSALWSLSSGCLHCLVILSLGDSFPSFLLCYCFFFFFFFSSKTNVSLSFTSPALANSILPLVLG